MSLGQNETSDRPTNRSAMKRTGGYLSRASDLSRDIGSAIYADPILRLLRMLERQKSWRKEPAQAIVNPHQR